MASSPKLLTAILVLSLVLLASCSGEIPHDEGSECVFRGTCKTRADCEKICGADEVLCVPDISTARRCCCLQHDDPPRTVRPALRI